MSELKLQPPKKLSKFKSGGLKTAVTNLADT
jgi:hypothetical protein